MKVKLTHSQIKKIAQKADVSIDRLEQILEDENILGDAPQPWYIIALKVIAYLIGLLLAGYGTASAATTYLLSPAMF